MVPVTCLKSKLDDRDLQLRNLEESHLSEMLRPLKQIKKMSSFIRILMAKKLNLRERSPLTFPHLKSSRSPPLWCEVPFWQRNFLILDAFFQKDL